jgi:tetratricopeptide (TPR) repeat protein
MMTIDLHKPPPSNRKMYQLPPHDFHAEHAVVGCAIYDPHLAPELRLEWFYNLGCKTAADVLLKLAAEGNPIDPEILKQQLASFQQLYQLATELVKQEKAEQAVAAFERCLELEPQSLRAWAIKSAALNEAQHHSEALDAAEVSIPLHPRSEVLWVQKAKALLALRQIDQALLAVETALQLNPRFDQAWHHKALALLASGRKLEALPAFDAALALNPRRVDYLVEKTRTLSELGRKDEVLTHCDKTIDIDPATGWFNKGAAFLNDFKDPTRALPCFEKAKHFGHSQAARAIELCKSSRKTSRL